MRGSLSVLFGCATDQQQAPQVKTRGSLREFYRGADVGGVVCCRLPASLILSVDCLILKEE